MAIENIEYIKFKSHKDMPQTYRSWDESTWTEDAFKRENVSFISLENAKDLKFDPAKKLNNLDGVKTVYFIKRTAFNRSIFKQMYPQIKIVNSPESADVVIYGSGQTNGEAKYFAFSGVKLYNVDNKFALCQRFMRRVGRKQCRIRQMPWFDPTVKYTQSFVKNIYILSDQQIDIINCMANGYHYIGTDEVFNTAPIDFKQEEITSEDMIDIIKQLLSQNKEIMDTAISVVAQMDIQKYGQFMIFAWILYRGAKATRNSKCPRFKIMNKPIIKYIEENHKSRPRYGHPLNVKYPSIYVGEVFDYAIDLLTGIDQNDINYGYLKFAAEKFRKYIPANQLHPNIVSNRYEQW